MTVTASCHARYRRRASDRASQTSASPNARAPTRAAVGIPGGRTPWTIRNRSAYSGVSDEITPMTPTAAAAQASSDSGRGVVSRKRTDSA